MALSSSSATISYRAAVADHATLGKTFTIGDVEEAMDVVDENLKRYESIAGEAECEGAQIVVFPEWGLFGLCPSTVSSCGVSLSPSSSRDRIQPFCQPIGKVGECLISSSSPTSIAGRLAGIAKKHSIVVVANVTERISNDDDDDDETQKIYNTEIAIDEDGVLLAKYYKMNPWFAKTFDKPPAEQPTVVFKTSFGVTFGLMVCYDLFCKQPQTDLLKQGVTQFPYSVAVPGFAGKSYFERWTAKNGVTLLSSNLGGGASNGLFSSSSNNIKDVSVREGSYTVATIIAS
mmetsp:Transcript_37498/g.42857  ORF Transcript_37498/g.42857 Transcript_37498/m.42857 type:complete len:289 (-) Transcript_37498:109-975(-)